MIQRLYLASVFIFSSVFIACDSVPEDSSDPGRTTIYFYQRGYVSGGTDPNTALTDAAVAAFEKHHPEIDVIVVGLPWTREGDLKLRAVLLNRRKIDLFRVTNDQLPDYVLSKGQLLSPADPYLTDADRADIARTALEAVTHDGQVMAWPLWSTALAVIGNTEIMRERGIEPPAGRPWTWNEFVTALEQATFTREDGAQVYGLTAAARPPLFEWSPLLAANAGPLFRSASGDADGIEFSPLLPLAIERAAELRENRVVPPSFGIDDQPTVWNQFRSGRAAFIVSSPAFIRTLASVDFPYVILPPPIGEHGQPITTGALGAFAVVAHPDEPERERATHELARYLTSAEIAEDVPGWYLATPVRRSVVSFRNNPDYAGLAEIAETAVYLNVPGGAGLLEQTIIPKLQAALLGESTPEAALESIRRVYERKELD